MKGRSRLPGSSREICVELGFAPTLFSASASLCIDSFFAPTPRFCYSFSFWFPVCIAIPSAYRLFCAPALFCSDCCSVYRPPAPNEPGRTSSVCAEFGRSSSTRSQKAVKLALAELSSSSVSAQCELNLGYGWAQFQGRETEDGQTGSR